MITNKSINNTLNMEMYRIYKVNFQTTRRKTKNSIVNDANHKVCLKYHSEQPVLSGKLRETDGKDPHMVLP